MKITIKSKLLFLALFNITGINGTVFAAKAQQQILATDPFPQAKKTISTNPAAIATNALQQVQPTDTPVQIETTNLFKKIKTGAIAVAIVVTGGLALSSLPEETKNFQTKNFQYDDIQCSASVIHDAKQYLKSCLDIPKHPCPKQKIERALKINKKCQ